MSRVASACLEVPGNSAYSETVWTELFRDLRRGRNVDHIQKVECCFFLFEGFYPMALRVFGLFGQGNMTRYLVRAVVTGATRQKPNAGVRAGPQRAIRCPAPSINSRVRYIITTAPA